MAAAFAAVYARAIAVHAPQAGPQPPAVAETRGGATQPPG
jgi:hypothetical protein